MPFLAPIGAAIAAFGTTVAAASTAIAGTAMVALGSGAIGTAVASGIVAVGAGVSSLLGGAGLIAAIQAWSTVALFASSFLATRPKVGLGTAGSPVDFQADPNAGIPLMLGRSATAGKVVHANTSGASNKNVALYYLVALTGGPLGNFESLIASDWACQFDGIGLCTGPAHYAQTMYLEVTPGHKPDPQAYFPGGVELPWIPEWTAAHMLSGVACAWWTLVFNSKAFPSGMPKPLFVIRGPPVYDPRADSTFPGGSGTQRWDDETTWSLAGNDNPFLQALTWCVGRWDNGKLTFGIGAPIDAIDVGAFVEGANVCEANLWKCGGEVLSSDRKWDVLTTILQAGGGEPIKLGGLISAYVRAPRVSLGTLVGADLVGDASITGTKRRRDRLNQIIPTYRSEDHRWELVSAAPIFVTEYIDADGGLRSREGSYPLVQDAKQVGQLATYDILDAREFEPIVLPVGPRWQGVKPGDCITITEPEFGMSGQPVIVQTRELDLVTGKVTLTCRSETPGKHDYALGRTGTPPPIPGFQPSDPGSVARPDAGIWTAWGGVLTGADGAQVPAIVVTGSVNDPNVSGVIVDWALELTTGPPATFGDFASVEVPASTRRIEIRAVVSGATYHVQVRYRSVRNVEGALALDLGLVTVGTLVSHGVSQIGGQTPQELIDQLNETTALGLETSDQAIQNAADIATNADAILFTQNNLYEATHLPDGTDLETYTVNAVTSGQQANAYAVTRVDAMGILRGDGHTFQLSDTTLYADPTTTWGAYKNSLQTSIGNNTAAITTEQTTRATADSALSTRIDSVTATAGNNTAAITTEQNARIAGDQANATAISNVNTTVNGHTASITTLTNSVNGLNAQWVLSVSSQGPGYARVAGIKVAANPTVSSIAFVADQIGFTDGSSNVFPLAVVGGKVYATNFQADDIKANTITTDKIVANKIDLTVVSLISGSYTLTSSGTQLVATGSTTTTGGFVDLAIWGNVSLNGGGGSIGCMFDLYIDGSPTTTFGQYCVQPFSFNPVSFTFRYHLPAGTHVHQVYGYKQSGGGPPVLNQMTITMTERKTQA